MIIYLTSIAVFFSLSNILNFYLTKFFLKIDIVPVLVLFFAKELKSSKYLVLITFIIIVSLFQEKFILINGFYIILFAILCFWSKKIFNIISIRYILVFTIFYVLLKHLVFLVIYYRKISINALLVYDILINTLGNGLLAYIFYIFFEKFVKFLREKSEKIVHSS